MAARTDHDRRDAQHAARATIAIAMGRYIRRLTEAAYAHIEEVATSEPAGEIDWSSVGTVAANRALAFYGVTTASAAIDHEHRSLAAGDDPGDYTPHAGL